EYPPRRALRHAIDEVGPFDETNDLAVPVVRAHLVHFTREHPIPVELADDLSGYRGGPGVSHGAAEGALPMQHDRQENGAPVVLPIPCDRLGSGSDALKDRGIVRWARSSLDTPVNDGLVLFHESEVATIDEPSLRGEQSIVDLVKATLLTGDEVIVAQGARGT